MSTLNIDLTEPDLKLLLEALTELEAKFASICENSDDEDIVADYGNDLVEVRLLLKSLKEKGVSKYGDHVLEFSRDLL